MYLAKYLIKDTLIIQATLFSTSSSCHSYGFPALNAEEKTVIVKNEQMSVLVRFEQLNPLPTIMKLANQRYTCTAIVTGLHRFEYIIRLPLMYDSKKLVYYLKMLLSLQFLSFVICVNRTLKEPENYLPLKEKNRLPRVLMIDEFRSHISLKDKMSLIFADSEIRQITPLPIRELSALSINFFSYSNTFDIEYFSNGYEYSLFPTN